MNTQHTAPWHWTFSPISNERIALVSADNKDVLLATDDRDQNIYVAVSAEHARLIVSAPDLLTALEKAHALLATIYAAIPFKAEIQDHLPYGLSDEIKAAVGKDDLGIRAAIANAKGTQ